MYNVQFVKVTQQGEEMGYTFENTTSLINSMHISQSELGLN